MMMPRTQDSNNSREDDDMYKEEKDRVEEEKDDRKQSEKQQQEDVHPVAVTLRNAFAPQQLMSQADEGEGDGGDDGIRNGGVRTLQQHPLHHNRGGEYDDSDENDFQCKQNGAGLGSSLHSKQYAQQDYNRNRGEEATRTPFTTTDYSNHYHHHSIPIEKTGTTSTSSPSYIHIPSMKYPARSRSETHSITHVPIEMELVAPYALLVQLKHSYKNCEEMKNRLSAQFGLGKMEHENSGKNDGDVNRFLSVCSRGQNVSDIHSSSGGCGSGGCNQASHPLWDHLDERLDDLYESIMLPPSSTRNNNKYDNDNYDYDDDPEEEQALREQLWKDLKSHLRIQCKVVLQKDGIVPNHPHPHSYHESVVLASVPLNPKRLVPLPVNERKDLDINLNGNMEPNILGVSKYNNSIPKLLPRNSILVHFSDGSTRVCPPLYDLLVRKKVIREGEEMSDNSSRSGFNGSGSYHKVEMDKFERRFEDDIFNMLGSTNGPSQVKLKLDANGHGNGHGHGHGHARANGFKSFDSSKGSFTAAFESLAVSSPSINSMQSPNGTPNNGLMSDPRVASVDMSNGDCDIPTFSSVARSHNATFDTSPILASSALSRIKRYSSANSSQHDEASGDNASYGREMLAKIEDLDEEMEQLERILGEEEAALKIEQDAQEMVSHTFILLFKKLGTAGPFVTNFISLIQDAQWLQTFIAAVADLETERIDIGNETVLSE